MECKNIKAKMDEKTHPWMLRVQKENVIRKMCGLLSLKVYPTKCLLITKGKLTPIQ